MKKNINSFIPTKHTRDGRIPVSSIETGCIPFNKSQISRNGYLVGEKPIKGQLDFVENFNEALVKLRTTNNPGWRNYRDTGSAHIGIAWVTPEDAQLLLNEKDPSSRVALFRSLKDVVDM